MRIGGELCLDATSFVAPRRALTVLLGDAQDGTSAAIKAIAGLERASAGAVLVDGRDVTKVRAGRRNVAVVFEGHALFPHMSVFDNVAYPLRVARLSEATIAARVDEIAGLLGFSHVLGQRPRDVSEGLKRRAGLARAVVREPAAYLFDRELAALEDDYRSAARDVIGFLREHFDATILMPSADGAEAARLADWLVVMADGRVLQEGPAEAVRKAPASLDVARRALTRALVLRDGGIVGLRPDGVRVRVAEGQEYHLPFAAGDAVVGERVVLGASSSALKSGGWEALPGGELLLFDSSGVAFAQLELRADD